jgi:RNA polymerase primary sigma factor
MTRASSTHALLLQYRQLQQEGRAEEAIAVRNQVVERNLGLVGHMMRHLAMPDVERDDQLQEGRCALIRAAERFDPERGFQFSTYASSAIYHALIRLRTATYAQHEAEKTNKEKLLEGTTAPGTEETRVSKAASAIREILESGVAGLTEDEATVIRERFGFDGCGDRRGRWHRQRSLREIGDDMGLSYERVRQLQESALAKFDLTLGAPT